jgi:hypothetical protein
VLVKFDHAKAYAWSNMARISDREDQRVAAKHKAHKNDDRTHRGLSGGWSTEDHVRRRNCALLGKNINASGTIKLFTERGMCTSYTNVAGQFKVIYQNFNIEVIYNNLNIITL